MSHSSGKGNLVVSCDIDDILYLSKFGCRLVEEAHGAILALVRILILSLKTSIVVNVLESLGWKTAAATMVIVGLCTVYKLLLGKKHVLALVQRKVAFQSSRSAKSPARSAFPLVFNLRDNALLTPINVLRQSTEATIMTPGFGSVPSCRATLFFHEVVALELLGGHICKLVYLQCVSNVVSSIVSFHECYACAPNGLTIESLFFSFVLLAVEVLPHGEEFFVHQGFASLLNIERLKSSLNG
mmetsp:Transcript_22816/g.44849  ORF Transcript_22816/g.44849 Transcript_22816/m.44849 type:complete len:242 (+) Transcript_22816:370-1095(+)